TSPTWLQRSPLTRTHLPTPCTMSRPAPPAAARQLPKTTAPTPGPVMAEGLGEPASKDDLKKRAAELNK
ncbi:unnamed protein product, partial [Aureobasidium vineae]